MDKRTWLPIIGYEGSYVISDDGIVMRISYSDRANNAKHDLPFEIKQRVDKDGYMKCALSKNGKTKHYFVHRLVAETYIKNILNKKQVNHKNGIKNDNRVENLEWVTSSENIRHRIDVLGVSLKNNKTSKKVIQKDMDGNIIAIYPSAKEAHRVTGLSQGHISECCRNETKQYKSFVWQYE